MRFHELDSLRPEQLDFVPRERREEVQQLILAFIVTIGLILVSAYAPLLRRPEVYAPVISVLVLVVLGFYVLYRKQTNLDVIMSTEFQNLLFAQSLTIGSNFALIVKRDGTIVHASDGLRDVFPHFDYPQSRALEGVFEEGTVRLADRERIMGAIRTSGSDKLIFPVFGDYEAKKEYIITVDPLPRPVGYSLVRTREYLGKRSGIELLPDAFSSTTIDKIDHMLGSADLAMFTTDATGRFEYVNPAFENLSGYLPGAILESKLALNHLFFSLGGKTLTEGEPPRNCTGDAVLLNKRGTRQPAVIKLRVLKDAHGKLIGAAGSVGAIHKPAP